jgi:hypothetical protein
MLIRRPCRRNTIDHEGGRENGCRRTPAPAITGTSVPTRTSNRRSGQTTAHHRAVDAAAPWETTAPAEPGSSTSSRSTARRLAPAPARIVARQSRLRPAPVARTEHPTDRPRTVPTAPRTRRPRTARPLRTRLPCRVWQGRRRARRLPNRGRSGRLARNQRDLLLTGPVRPDPRTSRARRRHRVPLSPARRARQSPLRQRRSR